MRAVPSFFLAGLRPPRAGGAGGIKQVERTGARSGPEGERSGREGGTREGRRGGAPRRGVAGAQGEGAGRRGCAPRSRLWGLGFAALGALGRELEAGTELASQRSRRDERRSRRLGFSLRPAPSVRPPDRWASAAATRPRPLRCPCSGGDRQLAWGCFRERRLPGSQCPRALQPPERFEATLELPCVQPRSPARGAAKPLVAVGVLSWGLPGMRAASVCVCMGWLLRRKRGAG